MADTIADRLRSLLASDVYTTKGRLRADDLLIRERVARSLGEASARLRDLASQWRADRVPPSTRENPFPSAEVMAPLRQADRLGKDIDTVATSVRGLPLMPEDRVWDRIRRAGLDELLQFDWALVSEADELAGQLAAADLGAIDPAAVARQLRRLTEVIADRRRYIEVIVLTGRLAGPWLRSLLFTCLGTVKCTTRTTSCTGGCPGTTCRPTGG